MKKFTQKGLVIIPARGGSKRIKNKNIKNFLGDPLIAYTIKQAKQLKMADRVIVDTDSPQIAKVARRYGAEVPFLRPANLAQDNSLVINSVIYILQRLKKEENYIPDYIIILQTTSPLREMKDIESCWKLFKDTDATTVLTVCETHPRSYRLTRENNLILLNGSEKYSTNVQAWNKRYILNGCFVYFVETAALLREKVIITRKTKAVVCDKWRSVDLDNPEDWVIAELLYRERKSVTKKIKSI
ncbi:MAG: acylneuraminate cytidylyltransferase family protein [bacterium]|nr:acylneuraminate cytidylyltransferase family protein [bacterium]